MRLSVYSQWTGKRLLKAEIGAISIDPEGRFISVDINDDETAKPEFDIEAMQTRAPEGELNA